jgi:cytochrome b pre-mRNA-processing protein 3
MFKRRSDGAAVQLHRAIVAQARQSAFYTTLAVPDTLDGRFELIALHGFLVMHRLKADAAGTALAREVAEEIFRDLDASLREMGAGDLGVGRRVKKMGEAFYGRIAAYDAALADGAALEAALQRNLYGTAPTSPAVLSAMKDYCIDSVNSLERLDFSEISKGRVAFPAPAGTHARRH